MKKLDVIFAILLVVFIYSFVVGLLYKPQEINSKGLVVDCGLGGFWDGTDSNGEPTGDKLTQVDVVYLDKFLILRETSFNYFGECEKYDIKDFNAESMDYNKNLSVRVLYFAMVFYIIIIMIISLSIKINMEDDENFS